ncbi:hypothetical protein DV38_03380 [Leptospira interrogans]|nr:hypothetical protein DV38_03380 [Leptospira interrogans]
MGNEEKEKIVRELRKGYQPEQNEKKSLLKKVIHLAIKTRLFKIQSQKNHRRVAQVAISS